MFGRISTSLNSLRLEMRHVFCTSRRSYRGMLPVSQRAATDGCSIFRVATGRRRDRHFVSPRRERSDLFRCAWKQRSHSSGLGIFLAYLQLSQRRRLSHHYPIRDAGSAQFAYTGPAITDPAQRHGYPSASDCRYFRHDTWQWVFQWTPEPVDKPCHQSRKL